MEGFVLGKRACGANTERAERGGTEDAGEWLRTHGIPRLLSCPRERVCRAFSGAKPPPTNAPSKNSPCFRASVPSVFGAAGPPSRENPYLIRILPHPFCTAGRGLPALPAVGTYECFELTLHLRRQTRRERRKEMLGGEFVGAGSEMMEPFREGRASSRPRGRGVPGMSLKSPVETARTKPGPPRIGLHSFCICSMPVLPRPSRQGAAGRREVVMGLRIWKNRWKS